MDSALFVSTFLCRIVDLMEDILGSYTEEIDLLDRQNTTDTFTSAARNITYTAFKVNVTKLL